MGPVDIIILIAAIGIVVGVVVGAVIKKKKGKSVGCGCGCSTCPHGGSCASSKDETEKNTSEN
ncbi:MAG: FeoB-associated Cys-rich membrane protein [Clostridia bacterium]|nr:FeoB-associated Cys-rich membrane protein [Clostridia bacterium]